MEVPKRLDLSTAHLLSELFASFEIDRNPRIQGIVKTIHGLLLSVTRERLREKVTGEK